MRLTEREQQALERANSLNAILSQSSIAEGAEAAQLRSRQQSAERLAAQKRAQDQTDLEATLAYRMREGDLDRASKQEYYDIMSRFTSPEQRTIRGEEQTHGQLGAAADTGQQVVDAGGDFKGWPDLVIGALRDWEFQGTANMLNDLAFNEDEKAARSAFASSIGNWRKNLSGAQVTGIERTLGADWDPTASGISSKEAIARARRLQSFINNNRDALGLPPLGGASGVSDPPDPSAPSARDPGTPRVKRGGKTYIKENGRWREE